MPNNFFYGAASLTCDRVGFFTRSLSSIADELKKKGHHKTIAAFDDSASTDTRNIKRKITSEIQNSTGQYIHYIGYDEKLLFLKKLQESLPLHLHDTARFFLFGDNELPYLRSAGGNRNAMLSAFAGKSFFSFDDDTELKLYHLRNSENKITLEKGKPDLQIGSYPDIESIEEYIELFADDPFEYIDSLLGADADDLIPGSGKAKVRALMLGIYGGRWFSRPFGVLFHEGEVRNSTYVSRDKYEKAKLNPFCYMQSPNTILTDSSFFVSTAVGVDAASIVPPFFPQLRNDDNAWSILLRKCCKDSLIAHLPFAVYHERSDKAPFIKDDFKKVGADLGLNIIYILSTLSEQLICPEGADPYELLGRTLIGLSELPQKKWEDMCRGVWNQHVGNTVSNLKDLLDKYEWEPDFWVRDVEKYMDILRSCSMEPEYFIPVELQEKGTFEEAGRLHRKILYNYGSLLTEWGNIWDEIIGLNISGNGLLGKDYGV